MLKKSFRPKKKFKVTMRAKVKKARLRRLKTFLATIVIVTSVIFSGIWLKNKLSSFLSSERFLIRELKTAGLKTISPDDLNLEGIKDNVNIWHLNSDFFAETIKNNPRIKKIHILKNYPDTVTLKFIERTPVLLVKKNEKIFAVDSENILFEPTQEEMNSLIVMENYELSHSKMAYVMNFIKMLDESKSDFKNKISSIKIDGASVITKLKDDTEVKWCELKDTKELLKNITYFNAIYTDATKRYGKIAYIDLTDIEKNLRAVVLPINKKKI